MANTFTLSATVRTTGGKGAARAARRDAQVPAVIYGNRQEPLMINLDERELGRHMASTFFTHVYELKIGNDTHKVIPRDVQFHVVTEQPMHVDFLRVSDQTKITASVPVVAEGAEKCPGVKNGGLLNIIYHELEVKCFANQIPEHITVDVSTLTVGQSIHLSEIKLPTGVETMLQDKNATIVTIATPSALRSKEDEAAATATVVSPADVPAAKQKAPEAAPEGNKGGPAPKAAPKKK